MLPLQDNNVVLTNLLPADPEPDQIVKLPKGQYAGGSNIIYLYKHDKLIGATAQLTSIQNISGKYEIARTTTTTKLNKNDIIRITGKQYIFDSVIFVNGFGWSGYDYLPEPQILLDKTYRVLHAKSVGQTAENFYLYDKICLETLTENKNATTNPTTVTK